MLKQTFAWTDIPDGDSFRKFAQAVLSNLYPGEMLAPDAPGKDMGIDDKRSPSSGGKATVFSFKRYSKKDDLLGALGKDAEILKRRYAEAKPGFTALWSDVATLEIWTNLPLSPQDQGKIKKLFVGLPLRVLARGGKYIEDSARRFPIVMHSFFGTRRVLLERTEAFLARSAQTPGLRLYYAADTPFLERDDEIRAANSALSAGTARVVFLTAASGTGKTRALIEFARQSSKPCYFLNPEVKDVAEHADELYAARGGVIVVDEAQDALPMLGALLDLCDRDELLKGAFQFVVSARPTTRTPVDELLSRWIPSGGLVVMDLKPLATPMPLLKHWGYSDADARLLERLGGGNPMWLTFAHEAVSAGRELASLTRLEVPAAYVRSRLGEIAVPKLDSFLGLIAALSPFNVDSKDDVSLLVTKLDITSAEALNGLSALAEAGVIQRGGRLHRIRPDLLSDHFLRTLLYDPSGRPSGASTELLLSSSSENILRILTNLAKAEASSGGDLLSPVVADATAGLPTWNNAERLSAFKVLASLAHVRPPDAVRLAELVFKHLRGEDEVEVPDLFGTPRLHTFSHEDVVRAAIDFIAPAIQRLATLLPTLKILETATTDVRDDAISARARKVLAEAAAWQHRYQQPWVEALLQWSTRRVDKLLSSGRTELDSELLQLACIPVAAILGIRTESTSADNRAITIRQGLLGFYDPIRNLRGSARAIVNTLLRSDWPVAARIGAEIADAVFGQGLVELPKYSEENRTYLLDEMSSFEPELLDLARRTNDLATLQTHDGIADWLLTAPLGAPKADFGNRLRTALDEEPGRELVLKVFGSKYPRVDARAQFAELGRKALAHFGEAQVVSSLADLKRRNNRRSDFADAIMVVSGEESPEIARRVLLAELARGTSGPEEEGLLAALFIGARLSSDDSICAEPEILAQPFLACMGYARLGLPTAQLSPTDRDRALLISAATTNPERAPSILVRAAHVLDDGEGMLLNDISQHVIPHAVQGHLGTLIDAWGMFTYDRDPIPKDLDLPELLALVAPRHDLLETSQGWELEGLLAKAANQERGFLKRFLVSRLESLAKDHPGDLWFFQADQFSRELLIDQSEVEEVLMSIVERAEALDISAFFLHGLFRDIAGNVTQAMVALGPWVQGAGSDKFNFAAELLREFPFDEAKLGASNTLLDAGLELPSSEREGLESSLHAAFGGYMISGNDTSELEARRDLVQAYAATKASPLNRPFYEALARSIEASISDVIRRDAERDLE